MKYNILIVDDSKAALFMHGKVIRLAGIPLDQVLTAGNGKEAIKVLEDVNVDLILTDINMPEMDGFEFTDFVKKSEKFKHIPIIMLSTEGREKYIEKAKKLGAQNYVIKPFLPEQIKKVVLATLGVEDNETNIEDSETCDF